jgi:hypothetical protein
MTTIKEILAKAEAVSDFLRDLSRGAEEIATGLIDEVDDIEELHLLKLGADLDLIYERLRPVYQAMRGIDPVADEAMQCRDEPNFKSLVGRKGYYV